MHAAVARLVTLVDCIGNDRNDAGKRLQHQSADGYPGLNLTGEDRDVWHLDSEFRAIVQPTDLY